MNPLVFHLSCRQKVRRVRFIRFEGRLHKRHKPIPKKRRSTEARLFWAKNHRNRREDSSPRSFSQQGQSSTTNSRDCRSRQMIYLLIFFEEDSKSDRNRSKHLNVSRSGGHARSRLSCRQCRRYNKRPRVRRPDQDHTARVDGQLLRVQRGTVVPGMPVLSSQQQSSPPKKRPVEDTAHGISPCQDDGSTQAVRYSIGLDHYIGMSVIPARTFGIDYSCTIVSNSGTSSASSSVLHPFAVDERMELTPRPQAECTQCQRDWI